MALMLVLATRPAPMKPRAILWDLFGDHLRYLDDGRVPMRALTQLLADGLSRLRPN